MIASVSLVAIVVPCPPRAWSEWPCVTSARSTGLAGSIQQSAGTTWIPKGSAFSQSKSWRIAGRWVSRRQGSTRAAIDSRSAHLTFRDLVRVRAGWRDGNRFQVDQVKRLGALLEEAGARGQAAGHDMHPRFALRGG